MKDFPGSWAEYRVFEGGILQVHHRISTPDALAWTDSAGRCSPAPIRLRLRSPRGPLFRYTAAVRRVAATKSAISPIMRVSSKSLGV